MGFSRTLEVACFTLAAVILSPFGPTVVAAHSITLNISGIIFMIPMCFAVTATIRTSYTIGQKSWEKAVIARNSSLLLNFAAFLIYFSLLFTFRENVASLYSSDEKVLALASSLLILNCIYMLPDSIQCLLGGVLQGFKDSKTILICTIISYWIIGLPLGYVLAWGVFGERLEAYGIWIGFICSLSFACVFYSVRTYDLFRHKKLPKLLAKSEQVSV